MGNGKKETKAPKKRTRITMTMGDLKRSASAVLQKAFGTVRNQSKVTVILGSGD